MIEVKHFPSFPKFAIALLSFSCTAILILRETLSNDAYIYHNSGTALNNGKSPWDDSLNPFAQYLYGPISAVTNSILAKIPLNYFTLVIKFATCGLLIYILLKLTKSYEEAFFSYLIIILTFSFRSNIQYGAVGGIGCILATFVILKQNWDHKWLRNALKIILVDFKPHIYLSLLVDKFSKRELLGLISLATSVYFLINTLYEGVNPVTWIETILGRRNGLESDPTIIAPLFLSFRTIFQTPFFIVITMISVTATYFIWHKKKLKDTNRLVVVYLVAILTTPYLHTIDTLSIQIVLVIWSLRQDFFGPTVVLYILLSTIWSNSLTVNLLIGLLLCATIWLSGKAIRKAHLVLPYLIFSLVNYTWFGVLSNTTIPAAYYSFLTSIIACTLIVKVTRDSR